MNVNSVNPSSTIKALKYCACSCWHIILNMFIAAIKVNMGGGGVGQYPDFSSLFIVPLK
jgi:hypothetical protein